MMIRVLSLGAGVQSTTLALMAAVGEIERPAAAIFADTQWEPEAVYRHLDWLEALLPYPVLRVTQGNIRQAIRDRHPQRVPLDEADLSPDIDPRQGDLFGNECEGMCGV